MYYGPPWREGVTNLARRLARFLMERNHEVYVLSPEGVGENEKGSVGDMGEILMYINSGGPISYKERLSFWSKLLVKLLLLKGRVDLVFIFAGASLSFGIRTALIKYISGAKTLVYLTAGRHAGIFKRVMAADRLAVISPYFLRWFPHAPVVYPFLPIDLASVQQQETEVEGGNAFRFLFLGALEKERGIETMLEAFAEATRKSKRALTLTLAWNGYGDYSLTYVRSVLSQLGIEQEVRICGVVDRLEAYTSCDAVLIPHSGETRMAFPVRILESLHLRKPLIVTDACGMGDLIDGGGVVVKRGSVEEMAQAMIRLADDARFYSGCVERCDSVLERYDSEKSIERLYLCIKEMEA
jgi:glycosyltransferase involved in cell wall biosynthesis